jgi:hypothetical protein
MQILRGLSSTVLPCRCLVGIYETYDGTVVHILDAKSAKCTLSNHENGAHIVPCGPTDRPRR